MDITVQELKDRIDAGTAPLMIDVREDHEWNMQHLPGAKKITLGTIPANLSKLAELKEQELVMICRSGKRSGKACRYLQQMGFNQVRNLSGGMLAWRDYIDADFKVR